MSLLKVVKQQLFLLPISTHRDLEYNRSCINEVTIKYEYLYGLQVELIPIINNLKKKPKNNST